MPSYEIMICSGFFLCITLEKGNKKRILPYIFSGKIQKHTKIASQYLKMQSKIKLIKGFGITSISININVLNFQIDPNQMPKCPQPP